jgi:lia operon protein LiaG
MSELFRAGKAELTSLKIKIMKTYRLLFLTIFLFAALTARGQEFKTEAKNSADNKLVLLNFPGDLPVTGYSGDEIVITAEGGTFVPPERAKGLKPVFPGGNDNTGLGLSIEKEGKTTTITCILPITRTAEYTVKVPNNLALEIQSGCEKNTSIAVTGMKNEIEIQNCQGIDLKNVTGPLVLSSISGDINISLTEISTGKPLSVNAISGEIDITLPAKAAASFELNTVGGAFYSDFEFTQEKEPLKKIGGNDLKMNINGGGPKFSITTVSGNVYIRKGN